jgi:hypothetical protein
LTESGSNSERAVFRKGVISAAFGSLGVTESTAPIEFQFKIVLASK